MTKAEIYNMLEKMAEKYANSTIENPNAHQDAVQMVIEDWMNGAKFVLENID